MSLLDKILDNLDVVSNLEQGEQRDVVSELINVVAYQTKIDLPETFKHLYNIIDTELRRDIELNGVKNMKTTFTTKEYRYEHFKMKVNSMPSIDIIEEIHTDQFSISYKYDKRKSGGNKRVDDLLICIK